MSRGNPIEFVRRLANGALQRCGNRVQLEDAGGNLTSAPVVPTHTEAQINGDTLVLAANTNRRHALFVNDSVTVIYIDLDGGAAAVNQGIRINANGGSYEMSAQLGNLSTGAVRANHGAGAVNRLLLVTEGV